MKRLAAVFILIGLTPATEPVRADDPGTPAGAGRDWAVYGGAPEATRYSRLTQIDRANVRGSRWPGPTTPATRIPGSELQCNPLVVDGVLYATTPKVNLVALDAATGRAALAVRARGGQARPRQAAQSRRDLLVREGDAQAGLLRRAPFPLLRSTPPPAGQPIPPSAAKGRSTSARTCGRARWRSVGLSTPGIIYKDLLIVGSTTSESAATPPGDIRAFDVRTGELRWSFHTVPRPGERATRRGRRKPGSTPGAANNWAGMALDAGRGLVFVPTGSAAYDFYGANRPGDNLFANSLLALKADTGERVWHFQTVRHDIWDRDLPAQPTLVTVTREGRRVDAVAQTTKSGYVYLFERESGQPLFPIEYRKVPRLGRRGRDDGGDAAASPRARAVRATVPHRGHAHHADAGGAARRRWKRFQMLRAGGQFVPGSREGTMIFPGYDGGAEWGARRYDPESSLLYVNANEMAWILTLVKQAPAVPGEAGQRQAALPEAVRVLSRRGPEGRAAGVSLAARDRGALLAAREIMALLVQGAGRMPALRAPGRRRDSAPSWTSSRAGRRRRWRASGPSPMDMAYLSDGYKKFLDADGYPAIAPPWGTLNAIDLEHRRIRLDDPVRRISGAGRAGDEGHRQRELRRAGGHRRRACVHRGHEL